MFAAQKTEPGGQWGVNINYHLNSVGFTWAEVAGHQLLQHHQKRPVKDRQAEDIQQGSLNYHYKLNVLLNGNLYLFFCYVY